MKPKYKISSLTIIKILARHLDQADARIAKLERENKRLKEQLTDCCHTPPFTVTGNKYPGFTMIEGEK